jgi:hypothetical protein
MGSCGFNKILVVPRVHRRTFNGLLGRENSLGLRIEISAETVGFLGAKDHGNLENLSGFPKHEVVIDDQWALKIGQAKEPLGLEINNRDYASVRG